MTRLFPEEITSGLKLTSSLKSKASKEILLAHYFKATSLRYSKLQLFDFFHVHKLYILCKLAPFLFTFQWFKISSTYYIYPIFHSFIHNKYMPFWPIVAFVNHFHSAPIRSTRILNAFKSNSRRVIKNILRNYNLYNL